jgi:hypothetical protein
MLKKFILTSLMLSIFLIVSPVHAQYGLDETADRGGFSKNDNVYVMIGTIVSISLGVLAIVFFGLVVYAGVRWMTARGNEELVQKAKDILFAAIIGLAVVLSSFAFSRFVLQKLGNQVTESPGSGGAKTGEGGSPRAPEAGLGCSNKVKDGFETDIDCGGNSCSPCAEGKKCIKNIDCQAVSCVAGMCSPPCAGSDVNCGGACVNKCDVGKKCETNSDCVRGVCNRDGICG